MNDLLPAATLELTYLVAAVCFIQGLRDMTHPRTAVRGNLLSATGMLIAVGITVLWFDILSPAVLLAGLVLGSAIGLWLSYTVEMTEMPQLVGLFNGFGGGASALVAGGEVLQHVSTTGASIPLLLGITAGVSGLIGSLTFTGSMVAAGKLHGVISGSSIQFRSDSVLKGGLFAVSVILLVLIAVQPATVGIESVLSIQSAYWILLLFAGLLGISLVLPIGGADMPVVIALLNSYSGLAAAGTGFVIGNSALIIAGTLVGAAGMILTVIMCDSMNRSLSNVFFGKGMGTGSETDGESDIYEGNITETSPVEVEMILDAAKRVVIVPGYGMAVGQAQHAVAELSEKLAANGTDVEFGIHPVAGRMPGHMNVLLAEADVPYDRLKDLDEINPTFSQTDVVLVVGANDVVNPQANEAEDTPIAGMPILEVSDAGTVIVNKRSLSTGFSGVANPLFARDNTLMLFGDAQESIQACVSELSS